MSEGRVRGPFVERKSGWVWHGAGFVFVAADARSGRARRGLHERAHALDKPSFPIQRLEVKGPASRGLEVRRAGFIHRHDAEIILGAKRQRRADEEGLIARVRRTRRATDAGRFFDHAQPPDLATFDARQPLIDVLHEKFSRGLLAVGHFCQRGRGMTGLHKHGRMEADFWIGKNDLTASRAIHDFDGVARGARGPSTEEHDVLRERPRFAGVAEVERGLIGMFQIRDRARLILTQMWIDERDGTARRPVIFGERADDDVRAGHGARV